MWIILDSCWFAKGDIFMNNDGEMMTDGFLALCGLCARIHLLISVLYKLFVCLLKFFFTFFCPYFLLSLYFLCYLYISLHFYFLTYLSTSSTIGPFHFQTGRSSRRPNWALIFSWFTLCCSIFCYDLFCVEWDIRP